MDIVISWVEALERGNYDQGRFFLRKDNSFCCLGVLCDISKQGEWIEDNDFFFYSVGDISQAMGLPAAIASSINLSSNIQRKLTVANDSGVSFPEIAKTIRDYYGI